jgi:TonB-linked SusC/RagA family outer membrane protein
MIFFKTFYQKSRNNQSQERTDFCGLQKTLLMKIGTSILILSLGFHLLAASDGNSQNIATTMLSISLKNESIKTAFRKIEKLTDFRFAYNEAQLESYRVSLETGTISLEKILNLILSETELEYYVLNNKIIIHRQDEAADDLVAIPNVIQGVNENKVTGRVTDKDGNPLYGATVLIKGTTKGTTADVNGNYSIDVKENATLVFLFVGYLKQEIAVNNKTEINVVMLEDVTQLKEVTINAGYYTVTEKTKTGNIAKVTAKEISNQPVTSPLMALQGRVAGLEITPEGGPGIAPVIRIRGHNSLRTTDLGKSIPGSVGIDGNLPLYIIDGIPVNAEPLNLPDYAMMYFGGRLDPLSTINPENIQSVEVLKDADATAIYGSRGANGVILITTKKGVSGKTDLDVNFYQGAGKVPHKLKLLNTQQYLAMRREAYKNDGVDLNSPDWNNETSKIYDYPDLALWDTTRYTDWQKELLGGTADITDLQLNVTGGNANTTFRLGGSYHRESQIYKGLGYDRLGANLSLNHTSANNKFSGVVALNYGVENNKTGGDAINTALYLPPNAPALYTENGEINWELTDEGQYTFYNPMTTFESPIVSNNRNLTASVNLSYLLFDGLRIKTNLGYTDMNGITIYKEPYSGYPPSIRQYVTPSAQFGSNHRQSLLIEPQISFVKTFGKHSLDIVAGFSYQSNLSEYQLLQGTNYTSDALLNSIEGAGTIAVSSNYSNYKYNSVFARIGYNYKERYLLNLTGRREGSSRFGPENRFGNFGAIGGAWIFSSEPWIKKTLPILNFGKLRASYGVTGNDMIGDYKYYDLYKMAPSTIAYESSLSIYPSILFNPDFKWEQTNKLEVAMESRLMNDRLGLEVSWYRNRSSNQLVDYTLPTFAGFSSVLKNFEATIENSGWEILLRGDLIRSENLQWNLSANITFPRNKLVAFPDIESSPYATIYKVGEPLSIQRTYIWTGVDPQTGLHTFMDMDDNGVINSSDMQFTYNLDSKCYAGLSSNLIYKGFELSFLLRFKEQKARYKPLPHAGDQNNIALWAWNERWQKPGDITDVQRFTQYYESTTILYNYYSDSDAITDASFIRLQTLSLSYTLPQLIAQKAGAKMVKIFMQGQNLFTISKYNRYALDVESDTNFPQLRMITAGLQLKF